MYTANIENQINQLQTMLSKVELQLQLQGGDDEMFIALINLQRKLKANINTLDQLLDATDLVDTLQNSKLEEALGF